jgi:terminase large subunit-like protein
MPTSFELTGRQIEATKLLGSSATHAMLYGGSRSGKTFSIIRAILTRAFAHKSRHAVLRYRFNHLKGSVIYDTLPRVMELCFPGAAEMSHMDKSDWFYRLPNGSEIWFGGLDEKERTEKILGQEYASIFLNECSQIPWSSRNVAMTRLAQKTPLRLRAYYDCNPPNEAHWTKRVFVDKMDPDTRTPFRDKDNYASLTMNPGDNAENLPPEYLKELENLPERMRRRFLQGLFGTLAEGALWTLESLDIGRVLDGRIPDMQRVVIGVDPSGCSGPDDVRSDEVGIVVVGLGVDGRAYVLEDLSGRFGPGGPQGWGKIVAAAFDRHGADRVVAETNFGGDMVHEVIRVARPGTPFKKVTASRGKVVRAEPISALYGSENSVGKISHVGHFPKLEDQLCGFTTAGYVGDRSPDRADACCWALAELFPILAKPQKKVISPEPKVPFSYPSRYAWMG